MKCDRCGEMVDETTTSSCSVGAVEVEELFPIDKERSKKLCSFDDNFFCKSCMKGNVCVDCAKALTTEEIELIEERIK